MNGLDFAFLISANCMNLMMLWMELIFTFPILILAKFRNPINGQTANGIGNRTIIYLLAVIRFITSSSSI